MSEDQPVTTMLERLERAMYRAMEADGGIFLGDYHGPNNETIVDGFVPLGDLARAMLMELRKIADEQRPGMIAFEGRLTKEQADGLRKHWAEMNYERPTPGVRLLDNAKFTPVAQSPAAFIDKILREGDAHG